VYPLIDPIFCEKCFEDMSHCTDVDHDSEPGLPCDKCWEYWSNTIHKAFNDKFEQNIKMYKRDKKLIFVEVDEFRHVDAQNLLPK
jgi:hypothetical protein